ncbi:unnamed protein product [Nesidiocoris tenuis]|uniref:ZP domain-containing protein n=1 Tax=Nesidiocoris tenuis TaxID=355587 RepID=A0A6H5HGP5_9HEMI|nr:unnamed protein product [Nesidiocoris tenuis]
MDSNLGITRYRWNKCQSSRGRQNYTAEQVKARIARVSSTVAEICSNGARIADKLSAETLPIELLRKNRSSLGRSANYNNGSGECDMSEMDRLTVAGSGAFVSTTGYDYLENNCVEEPVKLCEFKKLSGRILKTVDSVYQDVDSLEECKELCLNSPFRCHSYDYGDTGENVCRLSHHSRATLADIQDPYLDVPEASTYELSACYNVSIDCRSGDMVAKIKTSKLFNGKIYAKGSPNSCVQDVKGSLEFELHMAYDDVECNVKHQGLGRYLNDVVIQHHDTIVTSSDLGLAVTCQYDLTNKSVSNEVDLGVHGDVRPALTEEVIVDSPNVAMKITDRRGEETLPSAQVGDPLALKFEILDRNSPYEIFVRELVAMDGVDSSEIVLIDSDGCPTDHFIMGPLYKSADSGKILLSYFDAFKFPSSEVVQFRALVTPCMPTCEPVQCDQEDASGELRSVNSFGRRRRRRSAGTTSVSTSGSDPKQDLLLVQSIQITDKFGFNKRNVEILESETLTHFSTCPTALFSCQRHRWQQRDQLDSISQQTLRLRERPRKIGKNSQEILQRNPVKPISRMLEFSQLNRFSFMFLGVLGQGHTFWPALTNISQSCLQ